MIKKGEIITILAGLLFVYITDSAKAVINDVQITPDEPTAEDIITVVTFGTENQGGVKVTDTVVNITDSEIGLDITLEIGQLFVMTDWSYSVDIGRLSAAAYDLTVRTIHYFYSDTYFKTFQVVPAQPMTLDGSGTQGDPWLIQSLDDFNDFAADANYWDGYTRLETDVNLAGLTYSTAVIAPDTDNSNYVFDGNAFNGVFDGNDCKVIGLTIAGKGYLGLFGFNVGQVRNLGLERCNVIGGGQHGRYIGGLVGENDEEGSVSNCYATGKVGGYERGGGLVGANRGSVSNCYFVGDVIGSKYIGGLVGYSYGCVSNCYSIVNVNGTEYHTGGLVGKNSGSVSNCYSIGDVSGHQTVGGLLGANDLGSVSKCYSTSGVSGGNTAGGLMGWNSGNVSNCYSNGKVNGHEYVGGLFGANSPSGSVWNCNSTGHVSGTRYVGGLIGVNGDSVWNCYSTGDVSGTEYNIGGLMGHNGGNVSNCFWDTNTQTHGVTESIGLNEGTATNVSGIHTAEMQTRSTFTDANWDFINVWNIGENQTYPYLRVYLPSDINKDGIVNFLDVAITANQWMEGVE
ncbi:MAG: GLUG motif-containing protein [Planctomycetota bacterium]|jgi:hypothetical protein